LSKPEFLVPAGNWAEWVAAVGTSGALFFAFISLRIERAKDRILSRQQAESAERAQASLVAGWMHDFATDGITRDFPDLVIRVRNGSDLPIYGVTVSAEVGVRGKFYRALGAMAPHETREIHIPIPAPPRMAEVTPSLMFSDTGGRVWYREPSGTLRHPTDEDRDSHFKAHPGAYESMEEHPTQYLALTYEQQRGDRVE